MLLATEGGNVDFKRVELPKETHVDPLAKKGASEKGAHDKRSLQTLAKNQTKDLGPRNVGSSASLKNSTCEHKMPHKILSRNTNKCQKIKNKKLK